MRWATDERGRIGGSLVDKTTLMELRLSVSTGLGFRALLPNLWARELLHRTLTSLEIPNT